MLSSKFKTNPFSLNKSSFHPQKTSMPLNKPLNEVDLIFNKIKENDNQAFFEFLIADNKFNRNDKIFSLF